MPIRHGIKWRYYASLAKIVHCWRDNAKAMYDCWVREFGVLEAEKLASKLPAKCIAGRWCSIFDTERDLCQSAGGLLVVYSKVIGNGNDAPAPPALALADADGDAAAAHGSKERPPAGADKLVPLPSSPDDPQQEEQAAYRIRIGRWKRESLETVKDPLFWCAMKILNAIHDPYRHHFNFLKKIVQGDGHLAQLVCGKADQIFHHYSEMLVLPAFMETLSLADLSIENQLCLIEFAVDELICHSAGYHRRVISELSRFPMSLHWLSHRPAHEHCWQRRWLGNSIASTADKCLELNARKLKKLFGTEVFRHMAETGTCPNPALFSWGFAFSKCQKSDIVLNESHNSLIKSIVSSCKRIGLPLLSARCNVKRELGVGSKGAIQRWSKLRGKAADLLEETYVCLNDGAQEVLEDPERWSVPPPDTPIPDDRIKRSCRLHAPSTWTTYELLWATHYNRKLHLQVPTISCSKAFIIGKSPADIQPGDAAYLVGDKSYSQSHLVSVELLAQKPLAQIEVEDRTFRFSARIHTPITCTSGLELILHAYHQVAGPVAGSRENGKDKGGAG